MRNEERINQDEFANCDGSDATSEGAQKLLAACLFATQVCGGIREGLAVHLLDGGVYVMNHFNKWSLLNGTDRLDKALAKGAPLGPFDYDEGLVPEVIEVLRGRGWKAEYVKVEVLRKLTWTVQEVEDELARRRRGEPWIPRTINLLSFVPPEWRENVLGECGQ
jgi:hypothetical protein